MTTGLPLGPILRWGLRVLDAVLVWNDGSGLSYCGFDDGADGSDVRIPIRKGWRGTD